MIVQPKKWRYTEEPYQIRWSTELRTAFLKLIEMYDPGLSINKAINKCIKRAVEENYLPGYLPVAIMESGDNPKKTLTPSQMSVKPNKETKP